MPQSAIGPGMGVFSRCEAVLEADDSPMTVKTALQLINRELDEYLGGIQGEIRRRHPLRHHLVRAKRHGGGRLWYREQHRHGRRGISVDSVKHAGIVDSARRQGTHPPARRDQRRLGSCRRHPPDRVGMLSASDPRAGAGRRAGGGAASPEGSAAGMRMRPRTSPIAFTISAPTRGGTPAKAASYNGLIAVWDPT